MDQKRVPRWDRVALGALVFAAMAARAWVAWRGHWSTDPDRGIVHEMALDIAAGLGWPVFYYGQAYMGSLEPTLSALFCLLFGPSVYAIALGTAVPAALLVLPVYFLARRVAGIWGAIGAALFLVIGPDVFCAYMSSPRGGYAISLLVIAWVLALGARLADAAWHRERAALAEWFLLGIVAGVGWWTNPIVAPALGAAALVLLVALRGRFWVAAVPVAAAGFAAGAAPWLLWNAQNGWASLSMTGSIGKSDIPEALRLLAHRTWHGLGWPERSPGNDAPQFLFGVGGILLLALAIWRARRDARRGAVWPIAITALFALLFSLSYASSSFSRTETQRYVMPLLPALALAAGILVASLRRVHPALGLIAACAVLGPHAWSQALAAREADPRKAVVQSMPAFVDQLTGHGVDVLFAEYRQTWMNAHTQRRLRVVEPAANRVPFSDAAALLAQNPAFWPTRAFHTFVHSAQARATRVDTTMGAVFVDVRPAQRSWTALPRSAIVTVTQRDNEDASAVIDRDVATTWRADSQPGRDNPSLQIRLAEPRRICGLLLFSRDNDLPLRAEIDLRSRNETNWTRVGSGSTLSPWFWSGPQPYHGELYARREIRFDPRATEEIRITIPSSPSGRTFRFRVSEIVLLEDAGVDAEDGTPTLGAALTFIESNRIERIYANRWLSDRVAAKGGSSVRVDSSARLRRHINQTMFDDERIFVTADLRPATALLMPAGAAEENAGSLAAAGIGFRRDTLAGAVALVVTSAPPSVERRVWVGDFLFADRLPDAPDS